MRVISCFIIDEKKESRILLKQFISQIPWLSLHGEYEDADKAITAFRKRPVDVLFIAEDAKGEAKLMLPVDLTPRPFIALIAGSAPNTLEILPSQAAEYIPKPLLHERFLMTIESIKKAIDKDRQALNEDDDFIFVRDHKALIKVAINDIAFVEALGDYLKLHTPQRFYTMLGTMKTMDEKLKPKGFMRVHRSYLVALRALNGFEGGAVLIGNQRIPVSDTYKSDLLAEIEKKKL